MIPLCIAHAQSAGPQGVQWCDDGFASAWIVNEYHQGKVQMYPGVYGAVPPDVEGRDVIIVDFSYSLAVTAEIMRRCKSMTFIDHHKTAFEVAGYLGSAHPQATVSFDVSMCGAMLTWRHYFPDRAVPPWLHYINDRDLYLHKLPGCREFSLALRSWPQDFLTWSSILQDVPGLVKDGRPITRYYDRQCAQMAANNFRMVIGGCNVKVANCPLIFASEVAGILAKDEPFGAAFCVQMNRKVEFSLRSVPGAKDSRDVAEIAKQYHGGGHPNASGFTAPAGMVPWGDYVAKPSPATSVTP